MSKIEMNITNTDNGKYVVEVRGDGLTVARDDYTLYSFSSLQAVFEFADKLYPSGD